MIGSLNFASFLSIFPRIIDILITNGDIRVITGDIHFAKIPNILECPRNFRKVRKGETHQWLGIDF